MATRFYLPSSGSAPATPAFSPAWDVTSAAATLPMSTTRGGTGSTAVGGSESSAQRVNVLVRQFVSTQTIPSARTIGTGTISAVLAAYELYSGLDGYMQIVAKVVSGDGTTVRGLLYSGATFDTVTTTAGAQNEETTSAATKATRIWDHISLSPVAAQAGDRIVVEIGFRATNAGTFGYTWSADFGDGSASDYALTSGDSTSKNPWVEFSEDLFAANPGSASGSLASSLPALTGSLAATHTPPPPAGTLAGTLPRITGSMTGRVSALGTLAGALPALTGHVVATTQQAVETSTAFANYGYDYSGRGEVTYDPPITPAPAGVRRAKVMRVHQSLPAPNLVNGRPI